MGVGSMPSRRQIVLLTTVTLLALSGVASPALAGDASSWRNARTPLSQATPRPAPDAWVSGPYRISLDPTGTRLLAAQWRVRGCLRQLRVAEYHQGRWHGPDTVLHQHVVRGYCLSTPWPDISRITQSAKARTVVVVGNSSNGDDYTHSVAIRHQGRWSPARTLSDGSGDLRPPWAVARNGSVALTATHPMAEGGPLDVSRWQHGRWSQARIQPDIEWGQLVGVSPHGTTRWIVYEEQVEPGLRLATSTGGAWRSVVAAPAAADYWKPLTVTLASGGSGSILVGHHTRRYADDPGQLAVITCAATCKSPQFIPGTSGGVFSAWVAPDGRSARWTTAAADPNNFNRRDLTLWSWHRGAPALVQRTVARSLGSDDSLGSSVSSDGRAVAVGWRLTKAESVSVTARRGTGRWHDQRLRGCRTLGEITAEGPAAAVTVQCHGTQQTYLHGIP